MYICICIAMSYFPVSRLQKSACFYNVTIHITIIEQTEKDV